jgi:hypothetical protein
MIRRIGTTLVPAKNAVIGQGGSFRGPTGPTGPTGATGATGSTGSVGSTGYGVYYLQHINSDGITVYLTDSTTIEVFGISGNPPSASDSFNALKTTLNVINSGATTTNTFLWIGGGLQQGFTASYNVFQILGNGLTAYYDGNDLVLAGRTTDYSIGPTGSVLGSFGNTANAILNSSNNSIFKYQENTVGITTQAVSFATLNGWFQAKNATGLTNINLTQISGITFYITNPLDTSTNTFYVSGNTWTSDHHYHTRFSAVTGAQQTTSPIIHSTPLFNTTTAIPYGYRKVGSCCWCDSIGAKNCKDYVTEKYCVDVLNGTFSLDSCTFRRTLVSDFRTCDDYGACCVNGNCYDTYRSICNKFSGTFNPNIICSAGGSFCT